MYEALTEGAQRALDRAQARAGAAGLTRAEPFHLLAALVDDDESRAADLLGRHGLSIAQTRSALGLSEPAGEIESTARAPFSAEARAVVRDASERARVAGRARPASTEHLLAALLDSGYEFTATLESAGLRVNELLFEMEADESSAIEPLPLPSDIPPLELVAPADAVDLGRVLDASANRAREGLRVIEDYVRFALDDPRLTRRLKEVRHRVDEAVRGLDSDLLLGSRDVVGDVGMHILSPPEAARENPRSVVSANFKRAQEALRSLEEYTKLVDAWISGRFEVARYDLYLLEKLVVTAIHATKMLDKVRLYVLVGGQPTLGDVTWLVGEALAGGADAIQLREKTLNDRGVLDRAREVRILTAKAGARFFLNDRPDLARISGADGVHLGQDDMTMRDARRVLGPKPLIGVSTHNRAQLDHAAQAGASYLGVGPVFPSGTKAFDEHVGLGLIRHAAETTTLPWFAIGGIDTRNIGEILDAGARRVAVSGAITRADRPRDAAKGLRAALDAS